MKAKEEYAVRLQMAGMHEEYIERMSEAYDNKYYVEAVWYVYAIFEQRINRLILKYIDQCNLQPERMNEKTVAISTRIACLKKVIVAKYGAFELFDVDLLNRISKWCAERNELVHGLISLKHYKQYDKEFESLAKTGVPLVFELYDVCTDFRNQWYKDDEPNMDFPVSKCKCNNQKCINPKSIL